jgi:DNA-damage-inducible protein J
VPALVTDFVYSGFEDLNMTASAIVTAEVDATVEREASEVLADLGLTASDVLRMTLEKLASEKSLPSALRRPNAITTAALQDADAGVGTHYTTVDDLFGDLDL